MADKTVGQLVKLGNQFGLITDPSRQSVLLDGCDVILSTDQWEGELQVLPANFHEVIEHWQKLHYDIDNYLFVWRDDAVAFLVALIGPRSILRIKSMEVLAERLNLDHPQFSSVLSEALVKCVGQPVSGA